MAGLPDEVWDGNGGRLDARTTSMRELLVALHVKVDRLISDVRDHENRIRPLERQLDGIAAHEDSAERWTARTLAWAALIVAAVGAVSAIVVVIAS